MKTILLLIYSSTIARLGQFCNPGIQNNDISNLNTKNGDVHVSTFNKSSMTSNPVLNNEKDITKIIPSIGNIKGPDFAQIYNSMNNTETYDSANLTNFFNDDNDSLHKNHNTYVGKHDKVVTNNSAISKINVLSDYDQDNSPPVTQETPETTNILSDYDQDNRPPVTQETPETTNILSDYDQDNSPPVTQETPETTNVELPADVVDNASNPSLEIDIDKDFHIPNVLHRVWFVEPNRRELVSPLKISNTVLNPFLHEKVEVYGEFNDGLEDMIWFPEPSQHEKNQQKDLMPLYLMPPSFYADLKRKKAKDDLKKAIKTKNLKKKKTTKSNKFYIRVNA